MRASQALQRSSLGGDASLAVSLCLLHGRARDFGIRRVFARTAERCVHAARWSGRQRHRPLGWHRVNESHQFGLPAKDIIVFQQRAPGFLIESRLRKRLYQQASHCIEAARAVSNPTLPSRSRGTRAWLALGGAPATPASLTHASRTHAVPPGALASSQY